MANSMRHKKTSIEIRALCAMIGLIVVLMIVPSPHLCAQEAGGTIVGTVTDPSGAEVSSANESIKNIATSVERSVPTNDDGLYVAPNLVPGSYRSEERRIGK